MKLLIRDFLVKSLSYRYSHEKVSEYDLKISQSHTEHQPMAPPEKATEH